MRSKFMGLAIGCLALLMVAGTATPGNCATWTVDFSYLYGVNINYTEPLPSDNPVDVGPFWVYTEPDPQAGDYWFGYCVDMLTLFGDTYSEEWVAANWSDAVAEGTPYTEDDLYRAAWMMWNYDPNLSGSYTGDYADYGTDHDQKLAIAIQMAIWELIFDEGLDVTSGNLTFSPDGTTYLGDALDWANAMLALAADPNLDLTLLGPTILLNKGEDGSVGPQAILAAKPVPEPATMLLFASASGLALLFRRKIFRG